MTEDCCFEYNFVSRKPSNIALACILNVMTDMSVLNDSVTGGLWKIFKRSPLLWLSITKFGKSKPWIVYCIIIVIFTKVKTCLFYWCYTSSFSNTFCSIFNVSVLFESSRNVLIDAIRIYYYHQNESLSRSKNKGIVVGASPVPYTWSENYVFNLTPYFSAKFHPTDKINSLGTRGIKFSMCPDYLESIY